jgi:AcrR family transcriptional regulator
MATMTSDPRPDGRRGPRGRDASADGRRARGDTSRRAVMRVAVDLASVDGLEGLTIGSLATEASMSKGGVVALFGSKEKLQLATIAAAAEIFRETVVVPALEVPGGRERLTVLLERWLGYSETRVFAGGCFFAAAMAEFGSRPGPVRDAVADSMRQWHEFLRRTIARAVERGELPADTDAVQLTFELTSILDGANSLSLLFDSAEPYDRARASLAKLLA